RRLRIAADGPDEGAGGAGVVAADQQGLAPPVVGLGGPRALRIAGDVGPERGLGGVVVAAQHHLPRLGEVGRSGGGGGPRIGGRRGFRRGRRGGRLGGGDRV